MRPDPNGSGLSRKAIFTEIEASLTRLRGGRTARRRSRRIPSPDRARVAAAEPGHLRPIVGARRPTHLDDATASLDIELSDCEVAELEAGYTPHPSLKAA